MNTRALTIPAFKQIVICMTSILVLALFIQARPVLAHAKLVKSEPPRRAALSEAPAHVQLWFNEEIEGSFASISVLDSDDKPVTDANPESVEDNLKTVILPLPEMSPGRYTVKFRVLSVDGHVVESAYDFTIKNQTQEK